MRYAYQVWGLCDNVACHRILTLQKYALYRLITFSAPRTPSNPIFSDLGILKFFNLVEVLNILFVHQLFNVDLPEDLLDTFDFSIISHSFNTRGSCLGLLKISSVNTKTYGLHSFSKLSIKQWNHLKQSFPDTNLTEISYSNRTFCKFVLESIYHLRNRNHVFHFFAAILCNLKNCGCCQ